jgi:archaeal flagellar protein FlaJ
MYEYLSNFYPKKLREYLYSQFNYFALTLRKEFIVGSIFFFSLCISLSVAFQFSRNIFSDMAPLFALIFTFIIVFLLLQFLVYTLININATNRGKFIENILPDALQLIAANLRAGMTIDRALIASNRIEFGYFNEQFIIVGKEVSTGTEISEALKNMTYRVKSLKFQKAIELIVTGLSSGGELSRLLSEVAQNLVHEKTVEEKIKTNVTTYLIFIGAAAGFAAPVLYGLSTVIVRVLTNVFSTVEVPASANMPFTISMAPETAEFLPGFVRTYTLFSLITLCIMASFLLGLIKKGEARYGISYIPFFVPFGVFVYWVVSTSAMALFQAII